MEIFRAKLSDGSLSALLVLQFGPASSTAPPLQWGDDGGDDGACEESVEHFGQNLSADFMSHSTVP